MSWHSAVRRWHSSRNAERPSPLFTATKPRLLSTTNVDGYVDLRCCGDCPRAVTAKHASRATIIVALRMFHLQQCTCQSADAVIESCERAQNSEMAGGAQNVLRNCVAHQARTEYIIRV